MLLTIPFLCLSLSISESESSEVDNTTIFFSRLKISISFCLIISSGVGPRESIIVFGNFLFNSLFYQTVYNI